MPDDYQTLAGGAYKSEVQDKSLSALKLKLHNPGTNCFVNSVIQMLRKTEYATFLPYHISSIDIGS